MGASLYAEMLTAHENCSPHVDLLLEHYGLHSDQDGVDEILAVMRGHYYLGVNRANKDAILQFLIEKLGTQQKIAEALGLKDRSSVSKMISSWTIESIRMTAAIHLYPDLIGKLPTRELAMLYGFAQATAYIKSLAYGEESIEGTMTPQDFSYLLGVLAHADWDKIIVDRKYELIRKLAKQIIIERTISTAESLSNKNIREEQYVLKLQGLMCAWADFAMIALWAIPECIPENDIEGRETI
jgi:hypothetical protein